MRAPFWMTNQTRAALVAALLVAGCASTPPAGIESYNPPLPGSTSTMSQTSSGSYGSGTAQITTTIAASKWQGQDVHAWSSTAGTMLLRASDGNRIGFLGPNGQPQWTLDPPVGFRYPMRPGKTWTAETRMKLPATQVEMPVTTQMEVVGLERVTVPAGSFDALRISVRDTINGKPANEDIYWVDTAQQMVVKTSLKRLPGHPAGQGTRSAEMVANTFKR